MQKFKKFMAVTVAAAMVMGGSMTAFAADTSYTDPTFESQAVGETMTAEGTGEVEGHVNKEVLSMILPTQATNTFSFKVDPQRLIQDTEGAKYSGATFPAANVDTGVYFMTGANTYSNSSSVLRAVNKSSVNVKLTVEAKLTNAGSGFAMAETKDEAKNATDAAKLYLGLKVGNETKPVKSTDTVTIDKVIKGDPANFAPAYKSNAYVYESIDSAKWNAVMFNLEGAVSKYNAASSATAPNVQVTWKYAKADSNDQVATDTVVYTGVELSNATVSSQAGVGFDATYKLGRANTYTFTGLASGDKITAVKYADNVSTARVASKAQISEDALSFTLPSGGYTRVGAGGYYEAEINNGSKKILVKITVVQ